MSLSHAQTKLLGDILAHPDDMEDFQQFALSSDDELMDLWIAIDEYDKQFKICDQEEDETEEEKIPRKIEVEKIMKQVADARHRLAPKDLVENLEMNVARANYKTTIFIQIHAKVAEIISLDLLKPFMIHQKAMLRASSTSSQCDSGTASPPKTPSKFRRQSAEIRFKDDIAKSLRQLSKANIAAAAVAVDDN